MEIQCDNDAFREVPAYEELARILRNAADEVQENYADPAFHGMKVVQRDANGNNVGSWVITD